MEDQNNIRIIFLDKAYVAFDEIINKFNLAEDLEEDKKRTNAGKLPKSTLLNGLIKNYARQEVSEKKIIESLREVLEVTTETAEQITKDIKEKIIPYLEKISEEKFEDPAFIEDISKKVFGEKKIELNQTIIKKPTDNIQSPVKKRVLQKKSGPIEETSKLPKKTSQSEKLKRNGPDFYREPVG